MKRTESVEIYAYQSNFSALGPSEQVVVLGSGTLSFVYLYKHTGLVVRVSGGIFGCFWWERWCYAQEQSRQLQYFRYRGKEGSVKKNLTLLHRSRSCRAPYH